jgi:hypothetical protein
VEGTVGGRATKVVFSRLRSDSRRIVCYKKVGDVLQPGARGLDVGSRMDVILGPEWQIATTAGSRVKAVTSVIARMKETA